MQRGRAPSDLPTPSCAAITGRRGRRRNLSPATRLGRRHFGSPAVHRVLRHGPRSPRKERPGTARSSVSVTGPRRKRPPLFRTCPVPARNRPVSDRWRFARCRVGQCRRSPAPSRYHSRGSSCQRATGVRGTVREDGARCTTSDALWRLRAMSCNRLLISRGSRSVPGPKGRRPLRLNTPGGRPCVPEEGARAILPVRLNPRRGWGRFG